MESFRICTMKIDFQYSTDFLAMNAPELSHTCMHLLSTGISRTEREVSYYAERLHVSPKYLSATVKRVTGHSVSSYINRATVPIIKKYLDDERLSLTQISELMHFTSLSYFSRYCSKHLGQSPSEYRQSLQPRRVMQ